MATETKAAERETVAAPIDAGVRIGHVHLKVADLERALEFYCGVLGFRVDAELRTQAAFISAGGYHHHIGLNTWESRGGPPPPPARPASIISPSSIRRAPRLADALRRLIEAKFRSTARRSRRQRGALSARSRR